MKLFDQARFTQAGLCDDHDQLAVALPRAFPAPRQHCEFVVAADEWRKLARTGSTAAAAGADEAEQKRRLRDALEGVTAAFFGDKEAGDLLLHPRRDQDRTRLCQRLHARGDVGDVPLNLACRIDHCRTGFEADACGQLRLAGAGVLAIEFMECALDRQRGAHRALDIVFVGQRIAEQRE